MLLCCYIFMLLYCYVVILCCYVLMLLCSYVFMLLCCYSIMFLSCYVVMLLFYIVMLLCCYVVMLLRCYAVMLLYYVVMLLRCYVDMLFCCHLWPVTVTQFIFTFSHKLHEFRRADNLPFQLPTKPPFPHTFCLQASHSGRIIALVLRSALHSVDRVLKNFSDIKFIQSPSSKSRVFPCGRT